MEKLKYAFLSVLLSHLVLTAYVNRALLFSKFDVAYWKDKYEQSQLALPLSPRTIGDDGRYLYEGYRLIHGTDPTNVLAEVPPLGKYLIGLSIVLFGNGSWYGALVTMFSVIVFFFLAKRLYGSTSLALATTTLFALDPLLVEQFPLPMLDSLQLATLLLFFLLLVNMPQKSETKKGILICSATGFILGLYSNTKIPLLTPVLVCIGSVIIWQKKREFRSLVLFLFAGFVGYLIPYAGYFIHGHSFQNWLSLQKWMLAVYQSSKLAPKIGSIWTTLFFNQYQNLFTSALEKVHQWTPLWPLVGGAGLIKLVASLYQRKAGHREEWRAMSIFTILTFLFYTFIPFWTRYILLILPFLYIGTGSLLGRMTNQKLAGATIGIMIIINAVYAVRMLFPTPEATVRQFLYDWEHGFFQDMYENLTSDAKNGMKRFSFHRFGQYLYYDGEIEAVTIHMLPTHWSRTKNHQSVALQVAYTTRHLGSFTETTNLSLQKEASIWKVDWTWSNLLPHLAPDMVLQTTVDIARRGSIRERNGTVLAMDVPGTMVWITPKDVDRETEDRMLQLLEKLFQKKIRSVHFHNRYSANTQPDWAIPVGVLREPINGKTQRELTSYPGLTLTPAFTRRTATGHDDSTGVVANTLFPECCSFLYTTTSYDGISGLELQYNTVLKGYNGGSLQMKKPDGSVVQTFISREKHDGSDVVL